jgi:hypothetical protein
MKKIILLGLVAFSSFAVNAQTKKSKKHATRPTKEALAVTKFKKLEAQKKMERDSMLVSLKMEDSARIASDSIYDLQKASESEAYRQNGLKAIDSMTKARYAAIEAERMEWDKAAKVQKDISEGINLSEATKNQVKIINTTYTEKAKLLLQGSEAQQKSQELIALNEERRAKLRAMLGKAKERKLEKERKEYIAKNGINSETAWMDIEQQVAKK